MIVNLILILSILTVIASADCKTCLEDQTYIWGADINYRMVPNTLSTCWGILSCNTALCSLISLSGVSNVIIQPNNRSNSDLLNKAYISKMSIGFYHESKILSELKSVTVNPGTCTEGQTLVFGLSSTYDVVSNSAKSCWGLLSCYDAICSVNEIPTVTFVAIEPSHG